MAHEWKIGDWAERDGTRFIVTRVEQDRMWLVGADPDRNRCETSLLCSFRHLPACTGWEWKPPKPIKKYRPFANAAEFSPHRDKWVRWKENDSIAVHRIHSYSETVVWVGAATTGLFWKEAFEKLEFEDGSPFGVKE